MQSFIITLQEFSFLQYCKSILYPLWKRHHLHGRWAGSEGSRGTREESAAALWLEYRWWTRGWASTPPYLTTLWHKHRNAQNTSLNIFTGIYINVIRHAIRGIKCILHAFYRIELEQVLTRGRPIIGLADYLHRYQAFFWLSVLVIIKNWFSNNII